MHKILDEPFVSTGTPNWKLFHFLQSPVQIMLVQDSGSLDSGTNSITENQECYRKKEREKREKQHLRRKLKPTYPV